jgi:hypothetical protein
VSPCIKQGDSASMTNGKHAERNLGIEAKRSMTYLIEVLLWLFPLPVQPRRKALQVKRDG